MPEEFVHADITRRIIGSAMAVHRALGSGFQEVIYQRALELEMTAQRLEFSREHEMEVFYRSVKIGMRRVDFFVEECVMVEIKALRRLEDVHLAQPSTTSKPTTSTSECSSTLARKAWNTSASCAPGKHRLELGFLGFVLN